MSSSFIPHPYQARAISDISNNLCRALLLEMGLGKTAIVLSSLLDLLSTVDISSCLVIAPLRVCYSTWPSEVAKWKEFRHLRVANLHQRMDLNRSADLYLINPEGLSKLFGRPIDTISGKRAWDTGPWSKWKNRPEMLIVDESTKFKNPQSARSKTLRRYLNDFHRRVILTGTPAPNGIMDLFGQMLLVDQGEALGNRITHFRKRFFDEVSIGPKGRKFSKFTPHDDAFEIIQGLIKPRVTVLEADDWIELPDTIKSDVPVILPAKALKQYCEARAHAVTALDDGTPLFAAGGAAAKLKQIANGRVYVTSPMSTRKDVAVLHDAKADTLEEVLEQLSGPALVAYEYTCDGEYLAKRFGAPMIRGGQKLSEVEEIIRRWNARELPVLFVQPQAAAHGLNLQSGGHNIIWYGPPWDAEVYAQFNARLARQGQASPSVFIRHLVAAGTIDERIASVLSEKLITQERLIQVLKEEIANV